MKRIFIGATVVLGFLFGYGAMAAAYYGQTPGYGYFGGGYDMSGWEVMNVSCSGSGEYGPYNYNNGNSWCNAIPRDLNTPAELIAFVQGRLSNGIPNGSYGFSGGTYGDARARTGAAAIVHTMLGTPTGSRSRPPTAAQMTSWRTLVNEYSDARRINWNTQAYSWTVNSLYQGTDDNPSPNDVTFYSAPRDGAAIVFTAPNGTIYSIRRECGNPMGGTSLPRLQDFDISGSTAVAANPSPAPGETIVFRHTVTNGGPTSTSPTSITRSANNSLTGTPGTVTLGPGSAGVLANGASHTFDENVMVPATATPGSQICRRVSWSPDTEAGGSGYGSPACATIRYVYSLTPVVSASITGSSGPILGNVAEPGDTITFTYAVNNTGITESQTVTCTYRQATHLGHSEAAPTTAFTPSGANCAPSRIFPARTNTPIATEINVPALTANTSICRTLTITPISASGGTATTLPPVCVFVAAKPYARIYGGDMVAGSGAIASTCASGGGASVVGWNRGVGGGYAGFGVQYATYALCAIFDAATSLGNGGGSAAPPTGLSFANTSTNVAAGQFGGNFGSVPAMRNYYSERPVVAPAMPASLGVGLPSGTSITYNGGSGPGSNSTLGGGLVSPNTEVTIYVDGNLYISSNITYAGSGSWTSTNIPMFRLIVRGNIYVDNDVTQLDGLYVAQGSATPYGIFYTCATGAAELSLGGTLASTCGAKLTVNGGVAARQIRLMRTIGTQRQSTVGEGPGSANIAEVFNYNPALWMSQPSTITGAANYDAINSLPPVL